MAVVYRHIRSDKDEVFYIGIGKSEARAHSKINRSKHWHNIVAKGYEVEIMLTDLTWDEACQKEREFIQLYGRKDLNKGTLCNYTDGGEGSVNFRHSDQSIEKIRRSKIGKPLPESTRAALKEYQRTRIPDNHHMKIASYRDAMKARKEKKIGQYTKEGVLVKVWSSITEASVQLGIDNASIGKACMGKLKTAGKHKWIYL